MTTAFAEKIKRGKHEDVIEYKRLSASDYYNLSKKMIEQDDEVPIILSINYNHSTGDATIKTRYPR